MLTLINGDLGIVKQISRLAEENVNNIWILFDSNKVGSKTKIKKNSIKSGHLLKSQRKSSVKV